MQTPLLVSRFASTGRALAGSGAATAGAAGVGSLAVDVDSGWYRRRELPPWQPPRAAFPVAWTALYVDIAVTSAAVLTRFDRNDEPDEARRYRTALGVNLALNAGWCALFFRARRTSWAAIGALALAASSTDLARRAARADPVHGAALAPYAAWCTFATALSADIWRRNR